jgi:hypothetical protein
VRVTAIDVMIEVVDAMSTIDLRRTALVRAEIRAMVITL